MAIQTAQGPFVPANPIEAAIDLGDCEAVIARARQLSLAERANCRPGLKKISDQLDKFRYEADSAKRICWGKPVTSTQMHAAQLALFICGNDQDRVEVWIGDGELETLVDLLAAASLRRLAGDLVQGSRGSIRKVHMLVARGLSERPTSDAYIVGLMTLALGNRPGAMPLLRAIEEDPGLLDGTLLRVFDVEGDSAISMAAIANRNVVPENSWDYSLFELVRRGVYTRALLLEKTIATLERDWPQFRSGWFSRFHAQLAPTAEEMAPLAHRYLGLCQSRIAPTVTLALSALSTLFVAGKVTPAALLDALMPVMSSAVKGQVDTALTLLAKIVAKAPDQAHAASALAIHGLSHEAAGLQKKIVGKLETWGVDAAAVPALVAMLPRVAADNRDALARLVGVPQPARQAPTMPAAVPQARLSPTDGARALARIVDLDELVQSIAYVYENDADIDCFERVLDGLVRLVPFTPAALARMAPVLKRARKIYPQSTKPWIAHERPIAFSLARVVMFACEGSAPPALSVANTLLGELGRRIDDAIDLMAQHAGLSTLSAATHLGGVLAPAQLLMRLRAHLEAKLRSPKREQVRALLRLAPGAWPDLLAAVRDLPKSEFVQALRYALGDDVPIGNDRALFAAAARIRFPDADDTRMALKFGPMGPDGPTLARYEWRIDTEVYPDVTHHFGRLQVLPEVIDIDPDLIGIRHHERYWEGDEALLRYGAAILPSNLEAFFADGVREIGDNLNWEEARWQDKAYLALLLDPCTPPTPMASKLLALALGGKEPGQTAMAIDALCLCHREGRLHAAAVADDIRAIIVGKLGMAARYAKSLGTAANADGAMPQVIAGMLWRIIDVPPEQPPKDIAGLLELLLELSLTHQIALPAETRAVIAALNLSAKGKTAQKSLLARLG